MSTYVESARLSFQLTGTMLRQTQPNIILIGEGMAVCSCADGHVYRKERKEAYADLTVLILIVISVIYHRE